MGFAIDKKWSAKNVLSLTANGTLHYPALKEVIIGALNERIWLKPALFHNSGESIILTDVLTLRKVCHKRS